MASDGVCGSALYWFTDYLSGCHQFVALEGASFQPPAVTSGVPQGSILGPLLFLVAFNGIFSISLSNLSDLTGYADDVIYSRKISSASDFACVTADLASLNCWIRAKGFRLNCAKVKSMLISRKRSPPALSLSLEGAYSAGSHEGQAPSGFSVSEPGSLRQALPFHSLQISGPPPP